MDLKLLQERKKKLQEEKNAQINQKAPLPLSKSISKDSKEYSSEDDESDEEIKPFQPSLLNQRKNSDSFFLDSDGEFQERIKDFSSEDSEDDDEKYQGYADRQKVDEKGKVCIDSLRDYQIEIFKDSYDKNSIIYLETGTGKTLVATMLIYYLFKKQEITKERKKIIFIANTVQLVEQQFVEIKERINLVAEKMEQDKSLSQLLNFGSPNNYRREFKESNIAKAHGNFKDKDSLKHQERYSGLKWEELKKGHDIFVMMGQVLLNGLRRAFLNLDEIEVIIFDECHHTRRDHPYNHIMQEFYHFYKKRNEKPDKYKYVSLPRIYGLTASPVLDVGISDFFKHQQLIEEQIKELCNNLDSQFAKYDMNKAKEFIKEIKEDRLTVECYTEDSTKERRAIQIMEQKLQGQKLIYKLENGEEECQAICKFYSKLFEFRIQHTNNLSRVNQDILEDLEKRVGVDSIQLDAQLGMYAVNLFLNEINTELQKTISFQDNQSEMKRLQQLVSEETKILSDKYKQMDAKGGLSKKFTYLFSTLEKFMQDDMYVFEKKRKEMGLDEAFNKSKKKEELKEFMKNNQSMVLVFVEEKIVIKYLREVLQNYIETFTKKQGERDDCKQLFRYHNVICLTGQSNAYDKRKQVFNKFNEETSDQNFRNNLPRAEEAVTNLILNNLQSIDKYNRANMRREFTPLEQEMELFELDQMKKKINDYQRSSQYLKLVQLNFEVKNQMKNIEAFRRKESQIILSTSVTEEGFDIPSCNLVISFNQINNLKSFVQIKGRARKENSRFLMLAKDNEQKDQIEINIQRYKDIITKIKEQSPNITKETPSQDESYQYRIVRKTGAILNTNWSTMLFHQYANFLTYDRDWNIKGPYFYYIKFSALQSYQCIIVLPPCADSERRFYQSQRKATKREAKREACFFAIIYLKSIGIFDEHDLISQNLTNQYDTAYEDPNDPELKQILKRYTQNEIDRKQKFKKVYFQSIMGESLTASIFQEIQMSKEVVSWTAYVYLLTFSNPQGHIPSKAFETNIVSQLGFIHYTKIPEDQRFYLEASNPSIYSEMKYIREIDMTLKEYERLQHINQFLNSISLNKDIEYYAELTQNPMNPYGRLYKEQSKKKNSNSFSYKFNSPNDKINALITLLKPSTTNQGSYDINYDHIEKLEGYINYMKGN